MTFRKKIIPAQREYFLRCDGPRGRMDWYDGCVYHTDAAAQKRADAFNARRNVAKAGKVVVAYIDREEHVAYETTLRL